MPKSQGIPVQNHKEYAAVAAGELAAGHFIIWPILHALIVGMAVVTGGGAMFIYLGTRSAALAVLWLVVWLAIDIWMIRKVWRWLKRTFRINYTNGYKGPLPTQTRVPRPVQARQLALPRSSGTTPDPPRPQPHPRLFE